MVTMTTIQPPSAILHFQLQDPKLCEVIDISLLISNIKFLWVWALPDFREGQVEQ